MEYLILLIGIFIVHFIFDWWYHPFKREILDAKLKGENYMWMWFHGGFMAFVKMLVVLLYLSIKSISNTYYIVILGVCIFFMEFITHSIIDIYKTKINLKYKLTYINPHYWTVIGVDNLLHHIIMVIMMWLVSINM